MAQTYTSTGTPVVPTPVVRDDGMTVSIAAIPTNAFAYAGPSGQLATDQQLFNEVQNFVALMTRTVASGGVSPTTGSALFPYDATNGRKVLFRIKLVVDAMLSQSSGS